jgi:membrane-bound serine protease (ClpP class)
MSFLTDPNILYLILLTGLWLGITATYMPGTGLLEILSVGLTLAGIWLLSSLAVNWWALMILIIGVVGFLVMPFIHRRYLLLAVVGLVLQVIGSLFLLPNTPVSPLVIAATIALALIYHYFALRPALERSRALPVTDDDDSLAGARGRAVTMLNPMGSVRVHGESWSARSDQPLDAGDEIIVLEREGLSLHVEGVKHKREETLQEAVR